MNDLILVIGGLVFLFILWVYTGGPNRPISFAGPYLTPITTTGDESEAYGTTDGFWESYRSMLRNTTSGEGTSGGSSWWGGSRESGMSVSLSGGDPSATDPEEEYLIIQNNSSSPVSITGWRLESEKSGASATIGDGERIARESGRSNIVLVAGEQAIVTTGDAPSRGSFAETICTGYLDTANRFTPSLSSRCPAPMDELGTYFRGNASRYDRCAEYVQTLQSCVDVRETPREIPNQCEDFVDARLSYRGCVSAHKNDADFFTGSWRVFLNKNSQLWRSSNDVVMLKDASGTVIDRYEY